MKVEHEENLKMIRMGTEDEKEAKAVADLERNKETFQTKLDMRKKWKPLQHVEQSFLVETKRTSIPTLRKQWKSWRSMAS